MEKTVVGVSYRHNLVTAYVKVVGRTEHLAERSAKRIAGIIRQQLPEALTKDPRYQGISADHNNQYLFEIPVIIGVNDPSSKVFFAKLQLKGDALDS